jgi:stage V sporulation protein B
MSEEQKPARDEARAVGRGALAIAFAKLYFILTGFVVQFGLPRLFKWALLRQGLGDASAASAAQALYGDYKLVNNTVSQLNNTVVTGTIQTVSKFASSREAELGAIKRRALAMQLAVGGGLSLAYALAAGWLADLQVGAGEASVSAAAELSWLMRISALIVLAYSFYAIFIGVLNGTRRFTAQAAFDVSYSTLRTVAIIGAAAAGLGVLGVFGAFVAAAIFICAAAAFWVGPLSGGTASTLTLRDFAREGGGIFGYTLLFNLLLFLDSQLLRPLVALGDPSASAEFLARLSGMYGAVQNLGYVPYQLVIAVTFVVFPLVSRATFEKDLDMARSYISNALRYSVLLLGVLWAALLASPRVLIVIPFGPEYGEGSGALRLMFIGQFCFALLSVVNTILLGAGKTGRAALAIGVGLLGVLGSALLLIPNAAQDGGMSAPMLAAAAASAIGTFAALAISLRGLSREFQPELPWGTLLRLLPLLGLVALSGWLIPDLGKGIVQAGIGLSRSVLGVVVVLLGMWLLGGFRPEDIARVKKILRRKG